MPPGHADGLWLEAERFAAARFANHAIARLGEPFGETAAGGVLFDLMGGDAAALDASTSLQFYPLRRLAGDLGRIAGAGLRLVNLVTEPVAIGTVAARFFPTAAPGADAPVCQAICTRYAALFGGVSPYIMTEPQVLVAIGDCIRAVHRRTRERRA